MRALAICHEDDKVPGLIAERAQQRGIEVVPLLVTRSEGFPDPTAFDMVLLMGSVESVYDTSVPWLRAEVDMVRRAIEHDVPILGICFGAQLLAATLGGQVQPASVPEVGWHLIDSGAPDTIPPGPWLEWHYDTMTLPPGAIELARSPGAVQAFGFGRHLGLQFHPEVTPDVIRPWALSSKGAAQLAEAGLEPEALLAETAMRLPQTRQQAFRLFDVFYERAVITEPRS